MTGLLQSDSLPPLTMTAITPRQRGRRAVSQRRRRMVAANHTCALCGREASVIDHITPLAHGGSDDDANTRALCHACHRSETARQFGHRTPTEIGLDGWPLDAPPDRRR